MGEPDKTEWQAWYEKAAEQPCTWWIENHIGARHALTTCLSCGMCTSVCPAAEHFEEYDPRCIVDAALSGDEDRLVELLKSDIIWYCAQCGSCNSKCPEENDIMGLVGSLRTLAQLKGYHLESVRGRQQYAGRHLWAANLWNRAFSLYFRNGDPAQHPDFGPRYARWQAELEEQFMRVGGQPDMDGTFAGRKVTPETLGGTAELHPCRGRPLPLGQDRRARRGGRREARSRHRPVLRQSEVGRMTALSSADTMITTKAPSRLMGQPRKANVITRPRSEADPRRRLLPDDELCHGNLLSVRSSLSSRGFTTFSGGVGRWAGRDRRR